MICAGDVFSIKHKHGFYGAFRILKAEGKFEHSNHEFLIIAITPYIGKEKANISDESLSKVFKYSHESRFYPEINIFSSIDIEKNFELIGNIPLTAEEEKMQFAVGDGSKGLLGGHPSAGAFTDHGNTVVHKWRMENEREIYIKECEEEKQKWLDKTKNIIPKPKEMLQTDVFWDILAKFDWLAEDEDSVIAPAVNFLKKQKVSFIKQFEETLSYKLYCLDTKKHGIASGLYDEKNNFISLDYFLYTRCFIVAKGEEFYNSVLSCPQKMPKDVDFEILLSVASEAYEKKTKREFNYITGRSYETLSNKESW